VGCALQPSSANTPKFADLTCASHLTGQKPIAPEVLTVLITIIAFEKSCSNGLGRSRHQVEEEER
jgi:hypothetical protein